MEKNDDTVRKGREIEGIGFMSPNQSTIPVEGKVHGITVGTIEPVKLNLIKICLIKETWNLMIALGKTRDTGGLTIEKITETMIVNMMKLMEIGHGERETEDLAIEKTLKTMKMNVMKSIEVGHGGMGTEDRIIKRSVQDTITHQMSDYSDVDI